MAAEQGFHFGLRGEPPGIHILQRGIDRSLFLGGKISRHNPLLLDAFELAHSFRLRFLGPLAQPPHQNL